jgi:hypothetical protein
MNNIVFCICHLQKLARPQYRTGHAPEAIRSALWKRSKVAALNLFNCEAAFTDEGWDVPRDVAAFECPLEKRFYPLLPTPHATIRGKSMLEENELATRFEDSSDTLNRVNHSGNSAQRKRADHGIHAVRRQWNALSRQVQKLDLHLGLPPELFGAPNHPWVRLKCEDFVDFCPIVVVKIHAGTYTDLKNRAVRQRNNPLANLLDGWRISQDAYHLRIHVVSIERHAHPRFMVG